MCLQEFMYRQKQKPAADCASVAQLEEQRAFTPTVAGSRPAGGTELPVPLNWVVLKLDGAEA